MRTNEKKLAKKLKKLGHRYPNTRARYIAEAGGKAQRFNKNFEKQTHE